MRTVFISYRREESAGEARALYKDLVDRLGDAYVFMDVDSIALGHDFRDVLQQRLSSCDLLLALVGRDWLEVRNRQGARRLDDPRDFVRLEIATALTRRIPVTPVLLHGTAMPSPDQLPDDLRDFAYRNAFELSHTRWESDVNELMRRLGLLPGADDTASAGHAADTAPPQPAEVHQPAVTAAASAVAPVVAPAAAGPAARGRVWITMAVVAVLLAAGGYVMFRGGGRPDPQAGIAPVPPEAAPSSVALPAADPPAAALPAATPAETAPATASGAPAVVRLQLQLTGPGKCLDMVNEGAVSRQITMADCGEYSGQSWTLAPIGAGGAVRLQNAFSGPQQCLQLARGDAGTRPTMAPCADEPGQRWTFERGPANRFSFLRNQLAGPDRCLGVNREGAPELRMARCNAAAAQRWREQAVSSRQ